MAYAITRNELKSGDTVYYINTVSRIPGEKTKRKTVMVEKYSAVRDEADPLLDAADDTSHLETPLAVLALPVGAGIHIVPILDCLHHSAFRLESPDVLGNGISGQKLPPVTYTYLWYKGVAFGKKNQTEKQDFWYGKRGFWLGEGRKQSFQTRFWERKE